MRILGTDAYRDSLGRALIGCKNRVTVVSAYMTVPGVSWILERVPPVARARFLTRWRISDLVAGSSDLDIYPKLLARGYSLHLLYDLHAKVIDIDGELLYLGSANVTGPGFRLVPGGNREIGTVLKPDSGDEALLEAMFEESIGLTQALFNEFEHLVLNSPRQKEADDVDSVEWPQGMTQKGPIRRLWVAEAVWSPSPISMLTTDPILLSSERAHDLQLLGMTDSVALTQALLRQRFIESRIWHWLISRLRERDGELYFGEICSLLHTSLLDDPKPYRKDVKTLVSNLFAWSEQLGGGHVRVDRPNYSERMRLVPQ